MRMPFAGLFRKPKGAGRSAPANKQRLHPRLPFSDPATLCWTDESGTARRLATQIIDASEGGMAVHLREPVAAGARVWILLNDGTDGRAEVRYCNPIDDGYRVGLRFIAEERNSRAGPSADRNVLEWVDASDRLVGSFVSIRNARAGEIEVIVPEVIPCPAIVMLLGNEVRCLGCTRDWWPDGDSYGVRVEVISNTLPKRQTA